MIEDTILRDLFKSESAEHLEELNNGLLHLEKHPEDPAVLKELFRRAHSLKGGSRMLGVETVGAVAHRFETLLSLVSGGKLKITSEWIDRMLQGLDALQGLVDEQITGKPARVSVAHILAILDGESPKESPKESGEKRDERQETVGKEGVPESRSNSNEMGESDTPDTPDTIDTIRVDSAKLDPLMARVGELAVAKSYLKHRLLEIDAGMNFLKQKKFDPLDNTLRKLRQSILEDKARLDRIASEIEESVHEIRLLPIGRLFQFFPRMVRDLAREQKKEVRLVIEGEETRADKRIIEEMKDPLTHLIRNAMDHGLEIPEARQQGGKPSEATLRLKATRTATHLVVEVSDDGRGIDLEAIKRLAVKRRLFRSEELATMSDEQLHAILFSPGFSTAPIVTELSGRGVGLDVVRVVVERLKGTLRVTSESGRGTLFVIRLPVTLATSRVFMLSVAEYLYALPVTSVETVCYLSQDEIFSVGGRNVMLLKEHTVPLVRLGDLLEISENGRDVACNVSTCNVSTGRFSCVVLSVANGEKLGLIVDALLDEQEAVLKSHGDGILKRVRNISGSMILENGDVCMALDAQDLVRTARKQNYASVVVETEERLDEDENEKGERCVVLLAEDSITTRTREKRILEGAGYMVITAVDGMDAMKKLETDRVDAVVSDIQMPNLDGLELTERIRREKRFEELPVLLVTSLDTEEDKRRSMEVGADAYFTKNAFDQEILLDTLERLV